MNLYPFFSLGGPMDGFSFKLGRFRMAAKFRGRFDCKLDPKGRIKLPSLYRQSISQQESTLVITNGQYQGLRCLEVWPLEEWEVLEEKLEKMSSLRSEVQIYQRFYLSGAQPVNTDAQGRILVPQSLRSYADFSDAVVLVGMGKKFELWDLEIWHSLYKKMAEEFGATLAKMAEWDRGES